jgi:hypothetical protein
MSIVDAVDHGRLLGLIRKPGWQFPGRTGAKRTGMLAALSVSLL